MRFHIDIHEDHLRHLFNMTEKEADAFLLDRREEIQAEFNTRIHKIVSLIEIVVQDWYLVEERRQEQLSKYGESL